MHLLDIIHSFSIVAERTLRSCAPRSRLSEWFFWFRADAEALCLIADQLKHARAFMLLENEAEAKMFTECSVYDAAYFFGDRQYHGMKKRWPRVLLTYLTKTGLELDATRWQEGCHNGFLEARQSQAGTFVPCSSTFDYV
ncbi:hypothetical protein [Pantoea cypripedii]|uniref:Uncharacterized protein n=1 Tax=Pantoea cypripedii TaxID=55209 RepID=A0A1X1EYI0_PANCY|nr:hypothetical protein [Pantoea cypripedii]MBP2195090.1 hypothetical protein [Pantoea cypripedii]ORM94933.1 hypothetical protein HA50_16905 [Pantoea cypripedii]